MVPVMLQDLSLFVFLVIVMSIVVGPVLALLFLLDKVLWIRHKHRMANLTR